MLEIRCIKVNATRKDLQQLDCLSHSQVRIQWGGDWVDMVLGRVKKAAVFNARDYYPNQEWLLLQPPHGSAFLMHGYNQDVAKDLWEIIVV